MLQRVDREDTGNTLHCVTVEGNGHVTKDSGTLPQIRHTKARGKYRHSHTHVILALRYRHEFAGYETTGTIQCLSRRTRSLATGTGTSRACH